MTTKKLYLFDVIKFNEQGLIPAIAQDYKSGQVLMMAWMNRQSLEMTFKTGTAHYFSRSRGKLWQKGETSGHIQQVKEVLIDCDYDCLLLKVEQSGVACHTGRANCFFNKIGNDFKITINQKIKIATEKTYDRNKAGE